MATPTKKGTRKRAGAKASSASARRAKLNGTSATVIENTASVIPWLIKFAVVGITGLVIYRVYTNRFEKFKENSKYPASNISDAQAETRADAIYGSIGWFTNDFENVKQQFVGLNYNAIVKLYNAFGKQTGTLLGGELNLFEWIQNQFDSEQIAQLRFITGGAFF